MDGRQIGDCYAWVVRPDYNTDDALAYGLADEAGKLDLNTATRDMLLKLPGMTEDVADAIVDWRDSDSTVSSQGAEDDYYMSLPEPYRCKNAPLERWMSCCWSRASRKICSTDTTPIATA